MERPLEIVAELSPSAGLMQSERRSRVDRTAQPERKSRSAPRRDLAAPGERDESSWMPSVRALVIALLLGAAAGATAALWVTLEDAKGLITSVAS
jgi:hypothetical protein